MKKRTCSTFCYRDCDAFALYLHEQSRQGWHFKEWRFGLLFEKGEPADIHYAVEVFPNGAEMDTRPEKDTQEYAEYCETAGWKLIDSSRKFCIFRRTKENAVPIVEPEERFENIRKAEWLLWFSRSIPVFLLAGLQWVQMLSWNFKNWIFNDLMLLTLFFMTVVTMQMLWEGVVLLFWSYTRHRMLKAGEIPFYGKKKHWDSRIFPCFLYALFAVYLVSHQEQIVLPLVLPAATALILILLTGAGIAFWRPSRAENWTFQIVSACMILVFILTLTPALLFLTPDSRQAAGDGNSPPLIQADYMPGEWEISSVYEDHIAGFLGSADRFYIDCQKSASKGSVPDNTETDSLPDNAETDFLRYTVYQSSHPWILEKLWKEELPDSGENSRERTKTWGALSAVGQGGTGRGYKELVRYPDRLLVLYYDEKPEDSQIRIIRQKLCPVQ